MQAAVKPLFSKSFALTHSLNRWIELDSSITSPPDDSITNVVRNSFIDLVRQVENDASEAQSFLGACPAYGKIRLAYENVIGAMKDLRSWIDQTSDQSINGHHPMEELALTDGDIDTDRSRAFYSALRRIELAEIYATEAFNDRNADPVAQNARIEAFDVRLFCIVFQHWDNRRTCFQLLRVVFEFYFNEPSLGCLIFHNDNQSSASNHPHHDWTSSPSTWSLLPSEDGRSRKPSSSNPGTPRSPDKKISTMVVALDEVMRSFAQIRIQQIVGSLAKIVFQIALNETSLRETVEEFSRFFDDQICRYVSNFDFNTTQRGGGGDKPFLFFAYDQCPFLSIPRSRMHSYLRSSSHGVRMCIIDGKTACVGFDSYQSLSLGSPGSVWVTDRFGHILSVDTSSPSKSKVIENTRSWTILGNATSRSKIYAIGEYDEYVSVFDTRSEKLIVEERVYLPLPGTVAVPTLWIVRVAPNGLMLAYHKDTSKRFVLFASAVRAGGVTTPDDWSTMNDEVCRKEKRDAVFFRKRDQFLTGRDGESITRLSRAAGEPPSLLAESIKRTGTDGGRAAAVSKCFVDFGTTLPERCHLLTVSDPTMEKGRRICSLFAIGISRECPSCSTFGEKHQSLHSRLAVRKIELDEEGQVTRIYGKDEWCVSSEFGQSSRVRNATWNDGKLFIAFY